MDNFYFEQLENNGFSAKVFPPHFRIEITRETIKGWLEKQLQGQCVWMEQYNEIVSWCNDNKGQGLLLMGKPGQGKTLFARHTLPVVFCLSRIEPLAYTRTYQYSDLEDKTKVVEMCQCGNKCIIIDDIGNENTMSYGQETGAFSRVVDSAEKYGKILIITTNLTTDEIHKRYGERVMSRLKKLCRLIVLDGEDLRVRQLEPGHG